MTDPSGPGPQAAHPAEGAASDGTLEGYFREHTRPPAFQGSDGYPYTVSLEVEKTPDLRAPFSGYLVFPRWAHTGAGIVGHLETPLLLHGTSPEEVRSQLAAKSLLEVSRLLEEAIQRTPHTAEPC